MGGLRRRKKERGFLKCLSKDNTTKADPLRLTGPAICICQRIFLFNCSSFVFAPLEGINDDWSKAVSLSRKVFLVQTKRRSCIPLWFIRKETENLTERIYNVISFHPNFVFLISECTSFTTISSAIKKKRKKNNQIAFSLRDSCGQSTRAGACSTGDVPVHASSGIMKCETVRLRRCRWRGFFFLAPRRILARAPTSPCVDAWVMSWERFYQTTK